MILMPFTILPHFISSCLAVFCAFRVWGWRGTGAHIGSGYVWRACAGYTAVPPLELAGGTAAWSWVCGDGWGNSRVVVGGPGWGRSIQDQGPQSRAQLLDGGAAMVSALHLPYLSAPLPTHPTVNAPHQTNVWTPTPHPDRTLWRRWLQTCSRAPAARRPPALRSCTTSCSASGG